jgi:hypothetical protein
VMLLGNKKGARSGAPFGSSVACHVKRFRRDLQKLCW